MNALKLLHDQIVQCERCPRLRAHCEEVARVKRRAYLDWEYWGKPVPGFGDPKARVLLVGLAPGAHGANRTGRMFTGDSSGEFLYRALFETGFASQAESRSRGDGLVLRDAYITAAARCAPPVNKPAPDELRNCRPYLEEELRILKRVEVVVALGRIGFEAYLKAIGAPVSGFRFGHNRLHEVRPWVITSYHPSQQNTSTGKLTAPMLRAVFEQARGLLGVEFSLFAGHGPALRERDQDRGDLGRDVAGYS